MSLETVDKEYIGQVLLSKGFRTWFLYMFRIINGKPFIVEPIHKDMFDLFQNVLDRKVLRHNLNVPPRSAKTTCCKYLIAYAYAKNPKCNFIYTSYSQSLLADIANDIIGILEHPAYKAMYPQIDFAVENNQIQPVDEFWRDYFISNDKEKKNIYSTKKIITYAGGVCWFASLGSQLTGVGAAVRGSQEFSGGIICFPYEQEILTNAGKKKIGEIVENKENVLVLSYDFDKNKAEYMPIDRYIKNSGKFNCVTVHLKNGEYFKCTDNHKIYTLNRGWVEAALLTDKDIVKTCSNSFKLFKCNIKFFTKLFTSDIPISYSLQRFVRKFYFFSSFINNLSREILETFFRLNSLHRSRPTIKTFCDFIKSSGSFCNILNVFKSKFTTRKNKSSQFNRVLHIIRFSSVFKIFQPIIRWIRVKMPNLNSFRLFANKSPKNQTMNPDSVCLIVFSKINIKIAVFFSRFKFFLLKYYLPSFNSTSRKNFTFFGNYISFIINHIIFKFGYGFVNSVVFNNHIYDSYCVTVHKNHNLFVGKNQYILASNCDDGDKPADIHSEIMREKTHKYFSETLLSRLNDSNAFILNVQQRLHTEDLTGFLSEVYGYKSLVKPLLDDGVLQIPSQYSEERLVEIKKDDAVFSAQYQQEPVPETGMLIHTDKFKPYDVPPQTFDLLYICCDTAFSEKKSADNSAFMLMGVKGYKRYILDLYCKKVDFVNLRKDLKEFYNKALAVYGQYNNFSSIYIEAKASGISLIQQLRSEGLPVQEIYPTVHNNLLKKDEVKDKLTRFYEVQADIESGYVNIPASAPWLKDFIKECLAFIGGKQNSKDDMCFVAGTKIKTLFGSKNIEEIKKGDLIITPLGLRTVECSLKTGEKEVIYNKELNLKGTPNHKILTITNGYSNLQDINNVKECMQWNLKNLIIWKIKSLLFLTEKNIAKWGERESISYLMRNKAQSEKILKDFTLQFGNMSISKKFQKVMLFIIKTIIHIIITLIIWNVYHASNIWIYINKIFLNGVIAMRQKNTLMKSETSLRYGIKAKMGENGIKNTLLKLWLKKEKKESVKIADKNLIMCQSKKIQNMTEDGVGNATKNTGSVYIENYKKVKLPVYNLKVNGGVYFANNILVSNCDTLIYCLKVARKNTQTDWEAFARAFS